jgi:hypothetical protein
MAINWEQMLKIGDCKDVTYKSGDLLIITSNLELTDWLEIGDIVIYDTQSQYHVYARFESYYLAILKEQCELLSKHRIRTISEIINY